MAIFGYTWRLRLTIILQNIILIAVFVGIGWYLDEMLGTKPLLIAIGVIVSFILNQIVTIKIVKRYAKDKPQVGPADLAYDEDEDEDDKSSLI